MTTVTQRWPRGTGQWHRNRILVVSADPIVRDQLVTTWGIDHETIVACCPLDVIQLLESEGKTISTVVLSDCVGSALCAELAEFVAEAYPFIRVVVTSKRSEVDRSLPADHVALQ